MENMTNKAENLTVVRESLYTLRDMDIILNSTLLRLTNLSNRAGVKTYVVVEPSETVGFFGEKIYYSTINYI